jgi:hypothetical protein
MTIPWETINRRTRVTTVNLLDKAKRHEEKGEVFQMAITTIALLPVDRVRSYAFDKAFWVRDAARTKKMNDMFGRTS